MKEVKVNYIKKCRKENRVLVSRGDFLTPLTFSTKYYRTMVHVSIGHRYVHIKYKRRQ